MFSFRKKQVVETPKHVILTIHGFGRRRCHEFDNLALWGAKDDLEVVQFDLYDINDETDNDWMLWADRAKQKCEYYIRNGYIVDVVGFSMGGVIASYVAATCNIHRLVLISPAFQYLNFDKIYATISKQASKLWGPSDTEKEASTVRVPDSFTATFMSIIKSLKKYVEHIQCPVLIFHGDQDEVIPLRSSLWAYDKIPHKQKNLIVLHGGCHRLLMDYRVNYTLYQTLKAFIKETILPNEKPEYAKDILGELDEEDL